MTDGSDPAPLTIWHVNVGNHAGAVDGVAVMASQLARSQAALGHDVSFLATPSPIERERQESLLGPGVVRIIGPSVPRTLRIALRRMYAAGTRPDVLHCHSVYRPAHVVLFLAAKVFGVATIQSPHSGLAPVRLEVQRVRKEVYGYLFERWVHHFADMVLALQEVEREDVTRYARRRRPVAVVANSVDGEVLAQPRWDEVSTRGNRPVALLLARYDVHQKGLDRLARLAERLPEIDVRVHGSQDKNQPALTEQLRRSAPPNFSLNGPLHGEDKFDALRSARMFLMPSRVEGLSLALLEAMAVGVPCVVSEYVDRSIGMTAVGTGVGLSDDVDRDAATIRTLLTDPERLAAIGLAASDWVRQHCTADSVARQVIDSYRVARVDCSGRMSSRLRCGA